jgi:alanine racemase
MTGLGAAEIRHRGHPVWAEIDLAAIRHNISTLKAMASGAEVMGVVKGYAYGHGNPASARAMVQGGATRLGVARVAEAIHLREAGIEVPIHVFTEPPPEGVDMVLKEDITPTVYTETFARALSEQAAAAGHRVSVHVKVDTGMHRVGLPPDHVDDAIRTLRSLEGIVVEGVWSHLAVADVPGHPFTSRQIELFETLAARIERSGLELRYKHIANSAATMSLPESHLDLVRCGVASYGLLPGPDLAGAADLKPAMSLRARVNMVKSIAAGSALSYGLSYRTERPTRVVTVPAGYADGYARGLSGLGRVLMGGKSYKVSGTVCMDQFMVDVFADPVEVGATATLLGRDEDEEVTADELARTLGTINYEITTRVPSRVPRVYLNEQG